MLKGLEGVTTHEAEIFVPVLANTQDMKALSVEVRQLLRCDRPDLLGGDRAHLFGIGDAGSLIDARGILDQHRRRR